LLTYAFSEDEVKLVSRMLLIIAAFQLGNRTVQLDVVFSEDWDDGKRVPE
jgi:hypothetical protein